MRVIAKVSLLLVFLAHTFSAMSQSDSCQERLKKYEVDKGKPVLGQQAKEELRMCYLDAMENAIMNNECEVLQTYYNYFLEAFGNTYDNDTLFQQAKEKLRNCYLDDMDKAIKNNNCDDAQTYYETYRTVFGEDTVLEQGIEECRTMGRLLIQVEKNEKEILQQAEVQIDGRSVPNPLEPQSLEHGRHTLRISHNDYDLIEKVVEIQESKTVPVSVRFSCHGILQTQGNKTLLEKSTWYLNNKKWSNPPVNTTREMECGEYTIRVALDGYKTFYIEKVTIRKGKTDTLKIDLQLIQVDKYGYLEIKNLKPDARVYVDGDRCYNPDQVLKLKTGEHTIKVEHNEYNTQFGSVTIAENRTSTFKTEWTPKTCNGFLKIIRGKNADVMDSAIVFIDDQKIARYPFDENYSLDCGEHRIRIEHEDYEPCEEKVLIERNRIEPFEPVMVAAVGFLKIEGDNKVLSEADIVITNTNNSHVQNVNHPEKPVQLKKGKYKVTITHKRYEDYKETVDIVSGQTETLKVKLIPKFFKVTLGVSDRTADIYIDGELKKTEKTSYHSVWTGELKRGEHIAQTRKKGWKSSGKYVLTINADEKISLNGPKPYKNYGALLAVINNNKTDRRTSIGLEYGCLLGERIGLYGSGMWNLIHVDADQECDEYGYLDDGSFPGYTGQESSRWSIVAGPFCRLGNYFYLKVGAGFGARNVYWKAEDGIYYHNLGFSTKDAVGLELSLGGQYDLIPIKDCGNILISFDVLTHKFRSADFKIGIGYRF